MDAEAAHITALQMQTQVWLSAFSAEVLDISPWKGNCWQVVDLSQK